MLGFILDCLLCGADRCAQPLYGYRGYRGTLRSLLFLVDVDDNDAGVETATWHIHPCTMAF